MPTGLRRILLLLAISSPHVLAQAGLPLFQRPLQHTTPEAFQTRVASLGSIVRACQSDPKACDPAAIGDDDKVVSPSDTYQVRWQWLRKLIDDARSPNLADRSKLLDQASARLEDELAANSAAVPSQTDFAPARQAANSILARPEFRVVGNESWFNRKIGELILWINRLLTATANLSHRSPWLSPLMEWTFISLAISIVIVWVVRTMQGERLDLACGGVIPLTDWQTESAEWSDLARTEADAGNWREAIHCLYWASIVVLESKRLWRRDFARTPREYVVLLERNSAQQAKLRKLTRIFERIWYGLRDAGHDDYAQALALFEDLRHA